MKKSTWLESNMEYIRSLYFDEMKSLPQVSKILSDQLGEPVTVGGLAYFITNNIGDLRSVKEACSFRLKVSDVDLRNMYENGMSTYKIAKQFDMADSSVFERLKKMGVTFRDKVIARMKIKPEQYLEVVDMYNSGLSGSKIAKKYGVSKKTILIILHKQNVQIRDTRGSNNANWKGGITAIHDRIRNCTKYLEWRKQVFERDAYKSVMSGEDGRLCAHHIKPFQNILKEFLGQHGTGLSVDELFELALEFVEFWDMDNVVTVTDDEHKKIHTSLVKWNNRLQEIMLERGTDIATYIVKQVKNNRSHPVSLGQFDKQLKVWYTKDRWSTGRIAKEIGCATVTVWKRLNELGIGRSISDASAKRKIPKSEHAKITEMFRSGISKAKIAKQYGVSANGVAYILDKCVAIQAL